MNALLRVLLLAMFPVWALAAQSDDLAGPAFSDPQQTAPVPPGWTAKPILHREEWSAGYDLAVTLDQHLYPVMLPLIDQFAEHNKVRIAVQEGTCGISAGALLDKVADVGGYCCPPGPADRLPGLRFHTVGIAPLALLVSTQNPVTGLTLRQAREIFDGRIRRWSQVSAQQADTPIHPITRLHCKTRPGHWRLLLDNEDLFGPQVQEVATIRDMLARVAADPQAIGYEVVWNLRRHDMNKRLKALTINGYAASDLDALAHKHYPLYRTYSVTTWHDTPGENPLATDLVQFLIKQLEDREAAFGIIPVSRLRAAGWRFQGDELIGEPR